MKIIKEVIGYIVLINLLSCSDKNINTKSPAPLSDSIKAAMVDSLINLSNIEKGKGTVDYVDLFEKILKIDSSDLYAGINHAYSISHFKKDNYGAINEMKNLVSRYPNSPDALFALGTVFYAINPDSAFYYCEKAVELYPNNGRNSYNLSTYYDEQKRYDKAIICIEKAIKVQPNNDFLIFKRGVYKIRNGQSLEALEDLRIIPSKHKYDNEVYFNRALCFYANKQYENCIRDCDTSLLLDKEESGITYFVRGSARSYLGDLDGSFEDIKKAVELGNKDAIDSYNRLSDYLKKRKKG